MLRGMHADIASTRGEMALMRDVMATKADLAEVRQELKADISALRTEMTADSLSVRRELGEQIVGLRRAVVE
jgi:hypothetical protein